MRLSVVIPAFNEAQRIGNTLRLVVAYLGVQGYAAEIVVVDDGSSDDTAGVVLGFAAESRVLVRLALMGGNCGKGATVQEGMLNCAQGDYRLMYDADGSTPIEMMERVWPCFEAGADVVIGSRALAGADIGVRQAWYREGMGKLNNALLRGLGLTQFADTQCGFKVFTAEAAVAVFERVRVAGFGFDVEALFIAQRRGLRVVEVPVRWVNSADSRVHPLRHGARMVWDAVQVRVRAMVEGYDD